MIKIQIKNFIILFVTIFFLNSCTETESDRKNLKKILKLVADQKLDSAIIIIELAKHEILSREAEKGGNPNEIMSNAEFASKKFTLIYEEINNFKDTNYVNIKLSTLTNAEIEMLKKNKLENVYFTNENLNSKFISNLKFKLPNIKKIKIKVDEQKKKEELFLEERVKYSEESHRLEFAKKEREKQVEDQFSENDGSHKALTLLIKKNMNDPDSYEHISTKFRDDNENIFVLTKFRGKNSFGAKVINTVSARVDFNGNVIEILEEK